MCGILGVIQKNKPVSKSQFQTGLRGIKDRGRKKYQYTESEKELYGYYRLPTDGLDATTAASLGSRSLPLCLFNGIITNVDQTAAEFSIAQSEAGTDTQLLTVGLERHGLDFLTHCRGMFAIAYVTNTSITLARDTIGIKPLYYVAQDDMFAFASEMKALLPFSNGHVTEVQPGEIIQFDKKNFTISKQRIEYRTSAKKRSLENLFIESLIIPTRRYLNQTTKSAGLLLSGGLDSSLLLGLLAKHLETAEFKRIHCFSIGKQNAEDTLATALLQKTFKVPITFVPLPNDRECLKRIPRIVQMVESPYARVVKVALLQDALAKEIRRAGIDVVLSGEGADELFYGYRKFIDGLTFTQIDQAYDVFFREMFPKTLLQRLDRVFAQYCIEGRVPFLDQEIVAYASTIPARKKMSRTKKGLVVKIPLRKLAQKVSIPLEIAKRQKMPMLHGSTKQTNTEDGSGFLEKICKKKHGVSCEEYVQKVYLEYYGYKKTVDRLTNTDTFDMRSKELNLARILSSQIQQTVSL